MRSDDPHYQGFREIVRGAISRCGQTEEKPLERQKRQYETLVALEKKMRLALIGGRYGKKVYEAFIAYICDARKNILDARPYFRERQATFTQHISCALRARNVRALYRYRFNYRFVQFVMRQRAWPKNSQIAVLAHQIWKVRDEMTTINMPLAISRARLFHSRTPPSHLSQMDFVQIGAEGLMSGIDKFVPPYTRMLRGVAIGRMTGNFIEEYSETPIHFFPTDKRKIYRANKLRGRTAGNVDFEKLAEHVNEGVQDPSHRTDASEIASLLAAASVVSSDEGGDDDGDDDSARPSRSIERFAAPEETRPDVAYEAMDTNRRLESAIDNLTLFQKKLLRLRGVRFAM